MNALEVKNLTKIYPGFELDDVSFCVGEGRIVGLIGRNGAGKSTALKGILRLISASGDVTVFGKNIDTDEYAVKRMIGYVGGGFRYYPLKTVAAVGKTVAGFYDNFDEAKYCAYLLKFGIDERKRVRELSEGMKVKFALALAISHGARLLIMDEPTSGLDPLSREEFCDIVLELVKTEQVSVLFSTHITSDLMRITDDIVYISDGKIIEDAPLNSLLSKFSLAHFVAETDAINAKAMGIKAVKDGFEGLVYKNTVVDRGNVCDATLDNIMIHLEIENGKRGDK